MVDKAENSESWTGWAWSYVSSVLPAPWDDDWLKEQQDNPTGHTLHLGFYVDTATVTFKVNNRQLSFNFNVILCVEDTIFVRTDFFQSFQQKCLNLKSYDFYRSQKRVLNAAVTIHIKRLVTVLCYVYIFREFTQKLLCMV